jgi:hypothetical protein
MPIHKPKILADFPHFHVLAVRRGDTFATGYTRFELDGKFDRVIDDLDIYWFWLVQGENDCFYVSLRSLNKETGEAVLSCDVLDEPKVVDQKLAYLSQRWQANQIWMVLDPAWGWQRKRYQGADAFAEDYDAGETTVVDGREVRVWTKLELVDGREGASRHFPADDQTLPPSSKRRAMPNGWGHEHCNFCLTHIEAGEFGFCDPQGHWICEKCHDQYVANRDLSFVDEL